MEGVVVGSFYGGRTFRPIRLIGQSPQCSCMSVMNGIELEEWQLKGPQALNIYDQSNRKQLKLKSQTMKFRTSN